MILYSASKAQGLLGISRNYVLQDPYVSVMGPLGRVPFELQPRQVVLYESGAQQVRHSIQLSSDVQDLILAEEGDDEAHAPPWKCWLSTIIHTHSCHSTKHVTSTAGLHSRRQITTTKVPHPWTLDLPGVHAASLLAESSAHHLLCLQDEEFDTDDELQDGV